MCTVIITVPSTSDDPVRLLAVRDEDPERPWDRLGHWWPERYPGVSGIRDRRAGGAWLAATAADRRVSVLLNRHDLSGRPDSEVTTRGWVALDSVAGRSPDEHPATRGFNLVEVTAHTARVIMWDGLERRIVDLPPGTHMIAHDDVDDAGTARIATWLPEFRRTADAAPAGSDRWWQPWFSIVDRSAALPGDDERAIIRRQTFEGFRSYSLLVCVASVGTGEFEVRDAPLAQAGEWDLPQLV